MKRSQMKTSEHSISITLGRKLIFLDVFWFILQSWPKQHRFYVWQILLLWSLWWPKTCEPLLTKNLDHCSPRTTSRTSWNYAEDTNADYTQYLVTVILSAVEENRLSSEEKPCIGPTVRCSETSVFGVASNSLMNEWCENVLQKHHLPSITKQKWLESGSEIFVVRKLPWT